MLEPKIETFLSLFNENLDCSKLIVQMIRGKQELVLNNIELIFKYLLKSSQTFKSKVQLITRLNCCR